MRNIIKLVIGALFVIITACNSGKKQKSEVEEKSSEIATTALGTQAYTQANFTLQIPDTWEQELPSNRLRIAQFKLNDSSEYPVVVSYFGDMDNKEDKNIKRWKSQFTSIDEYKELEIEIKGITAIKIKGTYKSKPFPMATEFEEVKDFGTLAAIIPSNEGPYFLKLTAPIQVIEKQESLFVGVLNSYTN